jgi:thioredoxin 1
MTNGKFTALSKELMSSTGTFAARLNSTRVNQTKLTSLAFPDSVAPRRRSVHGVPRYNDLDFWLITMRRHMLLSLLLLSLQKASGFLASSPGLVGSSSRAPPRQRQLLMKAVRKVNTAEFEAEIQDCSTPIVVDIYAVWCGPCQLMAPQLEKVAAEYGDKCRFLKIDSDEEPEVASVLKINGLPTILFINDMSVVARAEGMLMAKELQELTDHHFFAGPAPKIEGLA